MTKLFSAKDARDLTFGKDHDILLRALEKVKEAASTGHKSIKLGIWNDNKPVIDGDIWCQAAWGKGKPEWHAMKVKLEDLGYTVTKEGEDGSRFESPYTVISWA